MPITRSEHVPSEASLHAVGVLAGLVAAVWLGAAEAPIKMASSGMSPFAVSLCMVVGVFLARWTFPTLLKGTSYVVADLAEKKHLIVWALVAGALWAVANTLTVFAIRDVGLAIAFPLWNTNLIIGLFWGRVLFGELKGASAKTVLRVVTGCVGIVVAAIMLSSSLWHGGVAVGSHAGRGVAAALGASVMWGTMYVPYRKAYLSGMNPLSFVTAFTLGELVTVFGLALGVGGGVHSLYRQLSHARGEIFWLLFGGFIWVVGDLFQQFAAKYIGISRGIPLSNTNQLWGLAWGALVFGELSGSRRENLVLVLGGSVLMIAAAALISTAAATGKEHTSRNAALLRECDRYDLDYNRVLAAMGGHEFGRDERRRWWDYVIVLTAVAVFVYEASHASSPMSQINMKWAFVLCTVLAVSLIAGGVALFRVTRFS